MSSIFANPSLIQANVRLTYTPGASIGVPSFDTGPLANTFQAAVNTSDLKYLALESVLPAGTSPVSIPTATTWTKLTGITVYNRDTYTAVQLTITQNAVVHTYVLPPNGGFYHIDFWPSSNVPSTPNPSLVLQGVDGVSGLVPSSFPGNVLVVLTGYT